MASAHCITKATAPMNLNPPSSGVTLTTNHCFSGAQIALRILVVPTTLGAAWVLVTSSESTTLFGIQLDARYDYSPALKFYVFGNAIACGFAVISLFPVMLSRRHAGMWKSPTVFFSIFLHDLVMMSLVLAGLGSATAIGWVGQHGNSHAGWIPICDNFHNFCRKITISLILSYIGFVLWLILTVLDVFKITANTDELIANSAAATVVI